MQKGPLVAALALIVLIAGAASALGIPNLRFWAWENDFRALAVDYYGGKASLYERRIESAQRRLNDCRKAGKDSECWPLHQSLSVLNEERARIQALQDHFAK